MVDEVDADPKDQGSNPSETKTLNDFLSFAQALVDGATRTCTSRR